MLLLAAGRRPEAVLAYRQAVTYYQNLRAEFPNRTDFQQRQALSCLTLAPLLQRDRPLEAAAFYRQALDLFQGLGDDFAVKPGSRPLLGHCHNGLAWLLAVRPDPTVRDPDGAVEHAQKAVDLLPQDGNSWNTLGAAYYRAEKWDAAREALEKATQLRGGNGDGRDWFFLAMVHCRLGHADEARQWLEKGSTWLDQPGPVLPKTASGTPLTPEQKEELQALRREAEELLRPTPN
jgi:tetratricopeptide (TPR) repeat protein